jgi:hypothetical protein
MEDEGCRHVEHFPIEIVYYNLSRFEVFECHRHVFRGNLPVFRLHTSVRPVFRHEHKR